MHQTLTSFNIDAQGFRKTKNENQQKWGVVDLPTPLVRNALI